MFVKKICYLSAVAISALVFSSCATTASKAQTAAPEIKVTPPPVNMPPEAAPITELAPSMPNPIRPNNNSLEGYLPPINDPILSLPSQNGEVANPKSLPLPTIAPKPNPALSKEEIAREIVPNFNVTKDYNRLTQCYGTTDFMGALMRVRASRNGAPPQLKNMAASITGLQQQMQPMVLAAATVKSEPKFRADYDLVAKNISSQIAKSSNPDALLQSKLQFLDGCQKDVIKWRGGK